LAVSATTFAELVAGVRDTCGRRGRGAVDLAVLRRVDSTSLLAGRIRRELAEDELALAGAALIAWEQTGGRGRQGRPWESPPGAGVYATVVGRLGDAAALQVLPLAVACALAEVLDEHLPAPCRLKWPNDLMAGGRKLGGVLVEAAVRAEGPADVLVGFGVNCALGPDELPTAMATSLAVEAGSAPPLGPLVCRLVDGVVGELRAARPREETVARWLRRSLHAPGDALLCRTAAGEVRGAFAGLTAEGLLRLDVAGKEEVLVSAEVAAAT
jgi:BirA family biotin operon repressor/biotin-[acetyl-CoA-carboxylase] ligase